MTIHWAVPLIGRPWVNGAQGPDEFDCWGLVRYIKREHYDVELPIIDVDAMDLRKIFKVTTDHEEYQNWREVDIPKDGDLVTMAQAKFPSHIGVYLEIDGGAVIHCVQGMGVCFSNRFSLRNSGWGRSRYWRLKDQ